MTGVTKQVPVGLADGTPTMSLRVFTLEPGGYTPYHSHPWEHINYILDGRGVMVDADGKELPIKAGDYALVLPDEMHQFRNTANVAGNSHGAGSSNDADSGNGAGSSNDADSGHDVDSGSELRFICLVPKDKE